MQPGPCVTATRPPLHALRRNDHRVVRPLPPASPTNHGGFGKQIRRCEVGWRSRKVRTQKGSVYRIARLAPRARLCNGRSGFTNATSLVCGSYRANRRTVRRSANQKALNPEVLFGVSRSQRGNRRVRQSTGGACETAAARVFCKLRSFAFAGITARSGVIV